MYKIQFLYHKFNQETAISIIQTVIMIGQNVHILPLPTHVCLEGIY